jgi:hypothetical protein
MSSWQSFFNQLTKAPKQNIEGSYDIICRCDKGKLAVIDNCEFKTYFNCSTDLFCNMIQIDKYKAKTFNNGMPITPNTVKNEKISHKMISPLDDLLKIR